jgi:nucleoside-diphosphate-sugar epimerase
MQPVFSINFIWIFIMKVLLTGSDGFIGSEVKKFFLSEGVDVFSTVFDKEPGPGEMHLDVTQPDDFSKLPDDGFDVLINFTGIVDQKAPRRLMKAVNADGVRHLAAWAAGRGCGHFIQISSIGVYGLKTLGQNRTEEKTKRYNGLIAIPYMRTKARAEVYLEGSGVPCTILRLPSVIGYGDTFVSPVIAEKILSGSFFFCGSGKRLVSMLYAKNLGPLLLKLMHRGPQNDAFNCSDFHVPWNDFISEYARLLKRDSPVKKRSLLSLACNFGDSGDHMLYTFSFFGSHFPGEKLHRLLNFEPPHNWREGVREGVAGYLKSIER